MCQRLKVRRRGVLALGGVALGILNSNRRLDGEHGASELAGTIFLYHKDIFLQIQRDIAGMLR